MTVVSKALRKKILTDPISVWIKQNPDIVDDHLVALGQLHQQYMEINTQLKGCQDQSRKISRLIGEAKREKCSSEDLVQVMRQYSGETKSLKDQLNGIAGCILNYFETDCVVDKTPNQSDELPPARVHAAQSPTGDQLSTTLLIDEHESWNRYVESNPASSLYHRAEWKDLIHKVFGHECYYLYASYNDDEVVGILPLVRLKSRLFGDFMVSMPYFNSGGAIANSLLIEQALMQAAKEHAEKIGSDHIEYRDNISREELPVRDEKVNMILSLPDTHDALWDSFSSKLRSQIRRAQSENTVIDVGGADCLDDFHTVFAQNRRNLGTPIYGKIFSALYYSASVSTVAS